MKQLYRNSINYRIKKYIIIHSLENATPFPCWLPADLDIQPSREIKYTLQSGKENHHISLRHTYTFHVKYLTSFCVFAPVVILQYFICRAMSMPLVCSRKMTCRRSESYQLLSSLWSYKNLLYAPTWCASEWTIKSASKRDSFSNIQIQIII